MVIAYYLYHISDINIDKLHYFLEDTDEEIAKEVAEQKTVKEDDCIYSNVFDLLIAKSMEMKPKKLESDQSILLRINKVRAYIKKYMEEINDPTSKFVVLSHYFVLKFWTAEFDKEDEDTEYGKHPTKWIHFKNCDTVYSDDLEPIEIV